MKTPLIQTIILLAVILLLGGGGGLGIVFLKTQTSATGTKIKRLESERADLYRKQDSLDAELAALHNPDHLRVRAQGLDLYPPSAEQIVRLSNLQQPYPNELAQQRSE